MGIYDNAYPTNLVQLAEIMKSSSLADAMTNLAKEFDLDRELSLTIVKARTTPAEERCVHYKKLYELYATIIQRHPLSNAILEIINDHAEYMHYKKMCKFYKDDLNSVIEATTKRKEAAAKGGEARTKKSKDFAKFIKKLVDSTKPNEGWESINHFLEINMENIEQENSLKKYNFATSNLRKTVTKWINSGAPLPELKDAFKAN